MLPVSKRTGKAGKALVTSRLKVSSTRASSTDDASSTGAKAGANGTLPDLRTLISSTRVSSVDGSSTGDKAMTETAARRAEKIHVFVDNSNIMIGAQVRRFYRPVNAFFFLHLDFEQS